jgi:hypothetical protein
VTLATIDALFGSRTGFVGSTVFHAAVAANGRPLDAVSVDDVVGVEEAAVCRPDGAPDRTATAATATRARPRPTPRRDGRKEERG